MSFVPNDRDLLGADSGVGLVRYAFNGSYPGIPDDESIVILNWTTMHDPWNMTTGKYLPFRIRDSVTSDESINAYTDASGVRLWTSEGGASHFSPTLKIKDAGDYFHAYVLDRVGNKKEIWQNGGRCFRVDTVKDPSLALTNLLYLNTAGGTVDYRTTHWRASILTLAPGEIPTPEQWAEWLRAMRNPDMPIHERLYALKGTRWSDYHCGEGLTGSTTLPDRGDEGKDLVWQSGESVDDVRVRRRVARRRPRRTFYYIKGGPYTGDTGVAGHDFGFQAGRVIVARIMVFDWIRAGAQNIFDFHTNDVQQYILLRIVSGVPYISVRDASPAWTQVALDKCQSDGGDFYIVIDGTSLEVWLNGHHVGSGTLAQAVSFAGLCRTIITGGDSRGKVCRATIWNPESLPSKFEDDIHTCTMDFENDPPNLTNKRLGFPLHSGILDDPTDTDVPNQGLGGGTLILSAQLSDSCDTFITGHSP